MDTSGGFCLSARIDRVHRPIHHSTKQEEKPFLRVEFTERKLLLFF